MPRDPNATRTRQPNPPTAAYDTALDAGLAAAFGADATPGGWSQPPLLRDDPSENAPLVQPSSAEMPRGTDDRYQLLGEIARGGMGVVLKGRDPDLGRDLAFKVLRQELSNKPAAVQRFVEEAQVGGQLQHPGIVPVYDIGRFGDGRPYFAMKLVKGRTLADLLAERTDPTVDRGRYLRHFLQVCNTLAYAHSKGVIHRDMKPSNVMVGAFDEVLVMDWGLAKVLARGGVADEAKASRASEPAEVLTEIKTARFGSGSETAAGSVMGTPAFMPPEQAGGEIDKLDERADVFGLGAVLCVILTGKPPYVSESGNALRLMAVRGQLDECYARLDACGADAELVGICKRSLSVNRDARPRDAEELAAAVSGYLAGVETRAHDAEIERERAEVRHAEERKRQKTRLTLGGVTLLVLLAGATAASWQWWRAESEEKKTRAALEQVTDEKAKTADALAKAKVEQTRTFAALNTMTDEGIEKLMTSQLEIGEEQAAFVKKVIELYDEATKSQLDTPEGRAARAHGYFSVGKLREQIQDFPGAVASHISAIEIYESLAREYPQDRQYRYGLATAKNYLFRPYFQTRRYPDAEREVRSAKSLLEALIAEDSNQIEYASQRARAEHNLGLVLGKMGSKFANESEAIIRDAVRRYEELLERRGDSVEFATGLVNSLANLSDLLRDRPKEREDVLRRAVAIGEQILSRSPNDPLVQQRLGRARHNLGRFFFANKKFVEAEIEHRATMVLRLKLAQRFSAIQIYREDLAATRYGLAEALVAQERYREAINEYVGCTSIYEELMAEGNTDSELRKWYVKAVYNSNSQPGFRSLRDEVLLRAIEINRKLCIEFPEQVANYRMQAKLLSVRGQNLSVENRPEVFEVLLAAIRACDELLARRPVEMTDYQIRAWATHNLVVSYQKSGRFDEAIAGSLSMIADHEVLLEKNPNSTVSLSGMASGHANLANTYNARKLFDQFFDHLQKSRDYLVHLVELSPTPTNRQRLAIAHGSIGRHLIVLKRDDEAAVALTESLALHRKLMAESPESKPIQRYYFIAATVLARTRNNQGNYDETDRLLKEVGRYGDGLIAANRDTDFLNVMALHVSLIANLQARKGDHAAASKAIPRFLALDADSAVNYFNAACILGHCIHALERDAALSEQVRKDLAAGYTDLALTYMRQGIEKGYRNHEEIAADADYEPFRMHPEFQRIMAELRKAREVAPPPREAKP